jgi:antitoxin VapB
MVVICAQRAGLTVALSRIVMAETPSTEFVHRTEATTTVFERLVRATKAGVNGAELFTVAAKAYADAGFPGEEGRHHQGGAIGYRSRDWVAHPASRDLVRSRQAFVWNPSITGTKVEETALLTPDGIELLTTSPGWPAIPISAGGRALPAPGWLTL